MRGWEWPIAVVGSILIAILLLILAQVPFWISSRIKYRRRSKQLGVLGLTIHPDELEKTLPQVKAFVVTASLSGADELWAIFSIRTDADWDRRIFKDAKFVTPQPSKKQIALFHAHAAIVEEVISVRVHSK